MTSTSTSDPDVSAFIALSRTRHVKCNVGLALVRLKPKERAELTAALKYPWVKQDSDDVVITHAGITKWLADRGIKVSEFTVGRHRRGVCCCD